MQASRRVLVVYNPTAGRLRRRKLRAVLDALQKLGCAVQLCATQVAGDAERIAAAATRADWDVVVAAGGDGTVNEVVNGLVHAADPPALAFLPLGTANVLAHEIGLTGGAEDTARCIALGSERKIHLGRANGRHFVLMASVGLDAAVVAKVSGPLKRVGGKLAYIVQMLAQLVSYPFPAWRVTIDGAEHRAPAVLVCNARHYGGGFVAAPNADLTAPSFEILLLDGGGWRHAVRYAVALALGHLPSLRDVRLLTGQHVMIAGPAGAPVQADGDLVAHLPVEIVVSDRTLTLLVPSC